MANRLKEASSAYLRAHAGNPVDWWRWGAEAFEEAKRRDVPVFVSVGYSSCHWCHVMNKESFSDEATAALLNDNFVAIKVDRQERPDVDAVMMRATQAMTGQGGWPNTVFLTPDGRPFFAGTYYPDKPRDGLPSFRQVLLAIYDAWNSRKQEAVESAATLTEHLKEMNETRPVEGDVDPVQLVGNILSTFDEKHAGFGGAPKFFNAPALDALLVRTDKLANEVALITLEFITRGGVYDQVGGGFHRYAVDAGWEVPHFEKMLYDNALMLGTLTRGWVRALPGQETEQRELLERAIRGTVGWLLREMQLPSGAFAASQDAEVSYYLWNAKMLDEVLSGNSRFAQGVFHVTFEGNMPAGSDAEKDGSGLSTLQFHDNPAPERIRRVCAQLLAARQHRGLPERDEAVVVAWNGYLIESLVRASIVLNEPDWLAAAKTAAEDIWSRWVNSSDTKIGSTSDYAASALGFARLSGALGDATWLLRAQQILDAALELFGHPDGGFWDAVEDPLLFDRPRQLSDDAYPSATATMIAALRLVAQLTDKPEYDERADLACESLREILSDAPRFAGWALADELSKLEAADGRGPAQIVIVDESADAFSEMSQAAFRLAPFGSAIVVAQPETEGFGELLEGRNAIDGKPTAYVCHGNRCEQPITDWADLRELLWGPAPAENV